MRRLLSIIMISFTICALGGLIWVQKELGKNKVEFQNHLMMRYQEPFDVRVTYDWSMGKFVGVFSKNGENPLYHVEKYQDGTFYDDLLQSQWEDAYQRQLETKLSSLGASKKKIEVSIPKGTDSLLFGSKVSFEGDILLEEAIDKGLEKKMSVRLKSDAYDDSNNKELNTYYDELSESLDTFTINYPKK